ncbi:carnosine N-methyltransferase-like [Senna tora]|uniref:Carnosine N-methyltransferase-like n=1 Tax=Senna tora TaxID=362788 RepID=A0A834WCG4_9FABA|nr:carnosine N-methyltransferase-like [Senna tora]
MSMAKLKILWLLAHGSTVGNYVGNLGITTNMHIELEGICQGLTSAIALDVHNVNLEADYPINNDGDCPTHPWLQCSHGGH